MSEKRRFASNDRTYHVQCIGIDKSPLATITVVLVTRCGVHVLVECRLLTECFVADVAFNRVLLPDVIIETRPGSNHPTAALTVVPMFLFFMLHTIFLPAETLVAITAPMIIGMHSTARNMIAVAIGVEGSTAAVRHCSGWWVGGIWSCWWKMRRKREKERNTRTTKLMCCYCSGGCGGLFVKNAPCAPAP